MPGSEEEIAAEIIILSFGFQASPPDWCAEFGIALEVEVNTSRGALLLNPDANDGKPIEIGDLWTMTPGNGGSAGSKGEIYFTAGIQGESQGLFGSISRIAGTDDFMVSGSSHGMTG